MKKQYIIGWRALQEALTNQSDVSKVWIAQGALARHQEAVTRLKTLGIPYQVVPRQRLDRLYPNSTHQGVIAMSSPLPFADLNSVVMTTYEQQRTPLIVACDGVSNVRNIGGIARTAVAVEASALLLSTHKSASISTDSLKASAGALVHIPICRSPALANSLHMLRDSGLQIIAASPKAETPYTEIDYTLPTALVIGGEHEGLSPSTLAATDTQVRIPIAVVESLNASVAAAVLLYEVWRQRNQT